MTDRVDLSEQTWLVVPVDLEEKRPRSEFGGWVSDEPSGRNAYWHDYDNVVLNGDNREDVLPLSEAWAALDVDGVNLLQVDFDLADEDEEADREDGKWPDEDELHGFVTEEFPEAPVWSSQSGGRQTAVVLTDEAFEAIWDGEFKNGWGVDSLKGPAAKGYSLAPFSDGYDVVQSGDAPVLDVEDLEESDLFERSETNRAAATDPTDYEPAMGRAEAHSVDSTGDMDVLLAAVNQLRPGDLSHPAEHTRTRSDGLEAFDPPYRASSSGESLVFLEEEGVWWDMKEGKGFFTDKLVALDMGLISSPHDRLEGEAWWRAIERLRELGAPVPEYEGGSEDGEPVAPAFEAPENDGGGDPETLKRIYEATKRQQMAILEHGLNTVQTALPGSGKTYGRGLAAAELDEPISTFQENKDLRGATEDDYEGAGLENFDLPSFHDDCRLCQEDDPAYDPRAEEWRDRGMSTKAIKQLLGEPEDDPYFSQMKSAWEEADSVTGDPAHMNLERAVADRHVGFDDVDAYGTFVEEHDVYAPSTKMAVMEYLREHRDLLPVEDGDISYGRVTNPSPRMAEAMRVLVEERPPAADIPETDHVTASTGAVVRALAEGTTRWSTTTAAGSEVRHVASRVVHEADEHVVHLRLPMHLRDARSITMMTATPVYPVFKRVFEDLGAASQIVDPLPEDMRQEYFDDVLGMTVVQTTEELNAMSGGNNMRPDKLRVMLDGIEREHGRAPEVLVSSKKALTHGERDVEGGEPALHETDDHVLPDGEECRACNAERETEDGLADVLDDYGVEGLNFARAVGTNEYGDASLGVVWGAPHYGDGYVKRVTAAAGDDGAKAVRYVDENGNGYQSARDAPASAERVETRWSTETSQEVYENMTAGSVLQALMRVGRDGDSGSVVYCHTSAIPDDVPVVKPEGGELVEMFTPAQRAVSEALADADGALSTSDLVEETEYSKSTVWRALKKLEEAGTADEVGEGDHGASLFATEETVSDAHKGMYKEKRNGLVEVEPDESQRRGVFTGSEADIPVMLEPGLPDSVQDTLADVPMVQRGPNDDAEQPTTAQQALAAYGVADIGRPLRGGD